MLASRQSEVCERNTRVDVRAGCAHCGSERVPVVPRGIRTSMEWSGLTRIGSSPLQIHIGFVSSHAKQIEHRKLSSGKAPSQSARGCIDARSPEWHKLDNGARSGQSRRQRSHPNGENEKSHSQNSANPPGADHKVTPLTHADSPDTTMAVDLRSRRLCGRESDRYSPSR